MGYTHYYQLKSNDEKKFAEAVALFRLCLEKIEEKGIKLCGGGGDGEPIVNDREIWLNGDGEEGLDHETFSLRVNEHSREFCKTARKPYDIAVCCGLLSFKEVFGTDFDYSSDGNCPSDKYNKVGSEEFEYEDEWFDAINLYRSIIKEQYDWSDALRECFAEEQEEQCKKRWSEKY